MKRKTQWQAKISLFLMQFRSEITNLRCFIISFFFFFLLILLWTKDTEYRHSLYIFENNVTRGLKFILCLCAYVYLSLSF